MKGGVFMGLCFFSGPSWEEDSLNKINGESLAIDTHDMFAKSFCGRISFGIREEKMPLPAIGPSESVKKKGGGG